MNDLAHEPPAAALSAAGCRGEAPTPGPWNAVIEQMLAHRSVRAYLPNPVTPAQLERIIAAAQSAATSSNLQAWSVVAVQDPDRRDRLATLAGGQRHIREAPLLLVWLADLARLSAIATARGSAAEGLDYLELFMVAIIDAALAAQNAAVALESLGLGCVYIGAIRNNPEKTAAELGLPPLVFPVFGLCVGTPDPARPTAIKPRLPQPVVLHREQYSTAAAASEIAKYDVKLAGFQAEQGMPPEVWTERVTSRVATPEALTGRHRMREALGNLGFALK